MAVDGSASEPSRDSAPTRFRTSLRTRRSYPERALFLPPSSRRSTPREAPRDAASTEAAVMRPLEESEIQQVFEKLFKFVGKNLKNIVDRADQPHCFRLHKKVRPSATVVPASPRVPRLPPAPNRENPQTLFPPRPVPVPGRPAPRLATTVMRKYPRFRTASVDEAQTIHMVEFLRLSRRGGERAGASNARSAFARPHPDPVASRRANTLDRFAKLTHFSFGLASRRRSRH